MHKEFIQIRLVFRFVSLVSFSSPVSNRSAPVPGDGSELGSLLQAALEKEDPGHAEQVGYPPESSRENYLATEGRWLRTTSPLVLLVTTK